MPTSERRFSVLSMNVKHFSQKKTDEKKVVDHIKKKNPDVFGLYEVEDSHIYKFVTDNFPDYLTLITNGQQEQNILVACRKSFKKIDFHQRQEFKAGNPKLRPGALLSFEAGTEGDLYGLLFLHTDSGTEAPDFGNRAEMFEHVLHLKEALDRRDKKNTKFMALGDLNTMGLRYPTKKKTDVRVEEGLEIDNLKAQVAKVNLRVLSKSYHATEFSKKYGESDLDHVIASTALKFHQFSQDTEPRNFEVMVDGWNKLTGAARQDYLDNISDHCSLYCEVVG